MPIDAPGGGTPRLLRAVAIASALPVGTVAGGVVGSFVDRAAGTSPWFTVLLAGAGFAAGVIQMLRAQDRGTPGADG